MTTAIAAPEVVEAVGLDKIYTVEEYFELEKHSELRHEFINGKLYQMPGESVVANRIAGNCGYSLRTSVQKNGYVIIRHDVRTVVEKNKKYRYPDIQVAKRSEITETHAITQPKLLIEVTSENSAKTDHNEKVNEYLSLPSLDFYLIVSRFEPLVQVYSRDERGWRFDIYAEPTDSIQLDCTLRLADIYENVELAESQSDV